MFQMKPTDRQLHTFAGLRRIVATLRGPDGCPWDKVQTHESLRPYLVEETYETLSALDAGDRAMLCEELGDLLLEVLLHIQIAEENGDFTLGDVVYSIGDKLVRRHPHVFADAVAETPDAVVEQWDKLKSEERGEQSALTGIPAGLPGLAQAQAIQRRASRAGFRFETVEQVWEALEEELDELRRAKTPKERTEEMGDSLFALANLARWYEADAEDALRSTSRGFSGVFTRMEGLVRERGIDLGAATVDEKMALWDEAKADART
jgi:tetrapyrrole methylase family protein/MazG family protein